MPIIVNDRLGEKITDESVLTFGIHAGRKVGNVPARYLIFLYEQKRLPENLKAYVVENFAALKKQEHDEYISEQNRRKCSQGVHY